MEECLCAAPKGQAAGQDKQDSLGPVPSRSITSAWLPELGGAKASCEFKIPGLAHVTSPRAPDVEQSPSFHRNGHPLCCSLQLIPVCVSSATCMELQGCSCASPAHPDLPLGYIYL